MIDYSKVKPGDKLKIVGMGAPGFAKLGDIVEVVSTDGRQRCDVKRDDGATAYFALTCGAQRLEPVTPAPIEAEQPRGAELFAPEGVRDPLPQDQSRCAHEGDDGARMSRRDAIREKIMARVRIDDATGCWIWTGPTSGTEGRGAGYPRMSLGGQTVAVHIVMWTNEHGYVPGKKELDHACRNRLCVRPEPRHVEMVTRKENARRREQAKRGMIGHNGGPAFSCEEAR